MGRISYSQLSMFSEYPLDDVTTVEYQVYIHLHC